MATFLLTWELGGGTGHCVNLQPIAEHLCSRGHRVYVALRDVSVAHRVFGYLRPFRTLPNLLSLLVELKVCAQLYVVGIDPQLRRRFEGRAIHFVDRRINIDQLSRHTVLAILNGNSGSAISFFLRGVPSFQIPMHLEQAVFGRRVAQLGLGLASSPDRPEQMAVRLASMIQEERFAESAKQFAARHTDIEPQQKMMELAVRIEQLA